MVFRRNKIPQSPSSTVGNDCNRASSQGLEKAFAALQRVDTKDDEWTFIVPLFS